MKRDESTKPPMKSPIAKRSVSLDGHKTSVSLEPAFWNGLKEIASQRKVTLSELVGSIDSERPHGNLSSAIRLFGEKPRLPRPSGPYRPAKGYPPRRSEA